MAKKKVSKKKVTSERRRASRLGVSVSVKIKSGLPQAEDLMKGMILETKDLTEEGLFITTEEDLVIDSLLEMEIYLTPIAKPLTLVGKVVWKASKKDHPAYYPGVGVKIIRVSEEDREKMSKYLHEKIEHFAEARELKQMYLSLKEMAGRLIELEDKHPKAKHFKTVIDSAVKEIDDVAHLLDREAWEIKQL